MDLYIHTSIISTRYACMLKILSCRVSELKGRERDIDKVLDDSLIQSEHYKLKDAAAKILNSAFATCTCIIVLCEVIIS